MSYFRARFVELSKQIKKVSDGGSKFADQDRNVEIVDFAASQLSVSRYVNEMREKRQMRLALDAFQVAGEKGKECVLV